MTTSCSVTGNPPFWGLVEPSAWFSDLAGFYELKYNISKLDARLLSTSIPYAEALLRRRGSRSISWRHFNSKFSIALSMIGFDLKAESFGVPFFSRWAYSLLRNKLRPIGWYCINQPRYPLCYCSLHAGRDRGSSFYVCFSVQLKDHLLMYHHLLPSLLFWEKKQFSII